MGYFEEEGAPQIPSILDTLSKGCENINVIDKHSMELESSTVDSESNSAILNISKINMKENSE